MAILKQIVRRLRRAWPEAEIELRADADFAVPALYEYCEKEDIDYTIGLISNRRLEVGLPHFHGLFAFKPQRLLSV